MAHLHVGEDIHRLPRVIWETMPPPANLSVAEQASALFDHLKFELDPTCLTHKNQFWFRQYDGRCNWLKDGQTQIGSTGYPRSRDWGQTTYADGVSAPRQGPNPREVSNAFFKVSFSHSGPGTGVEANLLL